MTKIIEAETPLNEISVLYTESEGKIVKGISPKYLAFARLYTTKGETFGKSFLCYAMVYDYELERRDDGTFDITGPKYLSCKANASRVLNHPKVQAQIELELLNKFNERTVDARTSEIILNGKDTDSIQAIKIFNDLKNRVTKKIEVTNISRPYASMSDEELHRIIDV